MARVRRPAADQAERDAATNERARNVLIDAGAGTGKTTVLVDRLVAMVAPIDGTAGIPIARIAAITFTRKAAGELRLRIRERLLEELAEPGTAQARRAQLLDALAGLDTAYVGTVHSFADRLLRLRPIEAQLSPSYEVAEDDDALMRETFDVLLHAVQTGTLAAELAGSPVAQRAPEVTTTLLLALEAGLRAESHELEYAVDFGLDALVEGFLRLRDVPPPDLQAADFDVASYRTALDEFLLRAAPVRGHSEGARWIRSTADTLARQKASADPLVLMRELNRQLQRKPRDVTKKRTFDGDAAAWKVWKAFEDGDKGSVPLKEALSAPLHRWLATRLVRVFPVTVALYEKVKARRQALDQVDLLAKLRDLLVGNLTVRGNLQAMFDHIFVDEFQDTDPLQAEIALYLCEAAPTARQWEDVALRAGALTLVGDPKQSIYRFRRADVAMYDRVREVVARSGALTVRLSANFRSVPSLISWLNDRFERILGTSPDGRPFDPHSGRVFHAALAPGRDGTEPGVHVVPFEFSDALKHKVDDYRRLEAQVLARYLRWLVEVSDVLVEDPLDRRRRRVRYDDIAILAVSTWNLRLLFAAFDDAGIPYASRGGKLFLADPIHQQFLLGLRALADRDDGVAEAALFRPPFFAIDPADLLAERELESGDEPIDDRTRRAREALALVRELRRERFVRSPGATARDLLERTAFGRTNALGPNGAQRLQRMRELCLVLEQTAAADALDYDAVTARLRDWVNEPPQLDPPHPVGTEAIQALTVHQAKGLEFPVVVLWDGKAPWRTRVDVGAWRMERDGRGWIMNLDGLHWEEPAGLDLRGTEQRYLDAERRRVIYVAATRARDLLVVPRAGKVAPGTYVCGDLLAAMDPALVRELPAYRPDALPEWAQLPAAPATVTPADADTLEADIAQRWEPAAIEASRPRFRPASVSGEAHAAADEDAEGEVDFAGGGAVAKPREGRFGSLFGSVVHQAIALALSEGLDADAAVRIAAAAWSLDMHLAEATADVRRALEALRTEGLAKPPGDDLQLEYPVAALEAEGLLVGGYIDLVGAVDDRLDVIDFKTDAPPEDGAEHRYPAYAAQVRGYARLLERAGLTRGRHTRCGLLFTADGRIRWIDARRISA
jgi:ATP-dependent helicase/nuclease subunit A